MKKNTVVKLVFGVVVLVAIVLLSVFVKTTEPEASSRYYATILALVPPIVAIALALLTKEVYSSLFIGVAAAALLIAEFKPVAAFDTLVNDGLVASLASAGSIGIILFLVLLGTIVALMNKAGGSAAFGRWASKHIKTRVGAQLAVFALGVLIFVDDYFNCLTVGSVMRPVSDGHRISRPKLAYLIDATAAPICMIAPISSWAAAVAGTVPGDENGFLLFVRAIPYNFYSLLTIVMILAISLLKVDFGSMKKYEDAAQKAINDPNASQEEGNPRGKVIDLVFPMVALILCCLVAMVYSGGFFAGETLQNAFANCDASAALAWGALLGLLIILVYLLARRVLTFKEAIMILTLAWSLGGLTNILGADVFVANLMDGAAQGLANFLPALIFLVAVGLSFATGTSWGTFGILIPIVANVFSENPTLLVIGVSACLAGAVCGDHISPISDTTIMASAGAQCDHVTHVSTQLPYALLVAAVSFVVYLLSAFVTAWYVLLPVGAALLVGVLLVIRAKTGKTA